MAQERVAQRRDSTMEAVYATERAAAKARIKRRMSGVGSDSDSR
jgi:hypothetical protein